MAKINITNALGEHGSLRWDYNPAEMHTDMDVSGESKAVYIDEDGGEKIVLKGHDFAYLDGELLKGRVEKIFFYNAEGEKTAVTSEIDFKAKTLNSMLTDDDASNLYDLLEKMFGGKDEFKGSANDDFAWAGKGDDVVKGMGGDDSISGESGNDVMIGGDGSDIFFFSKEATGGHDIITDFDAKGGGENQDHIAGALADVVSMKQVGDDLVLNYGDGNLLTLLGVHESQITEEDFLVVY